MDEQALVPHIGEPPGTDLKGKVGALESVSFNGGLHSAGPCTLSVFLCRAAPMLAEESQGTVSSTSITSGGLAFLLIITRSGFWAVMATSGGMVTPLILLPSKSELSSFQPLGSKLFQEIVDDVVVAPLVSIQGFLAVAQKVTKGAG